MTRARLLLAGSIASLFVLVAACSDNEMVTQRLTPTPGGPPAGAASQTPATPTPGPTLGPNDFGPAPKLGGNVTAISPRHAVKVPASQTKVLDQTRPGGVCFEGNFDGFEKGNLQWFRMIVDSDEVTPELTWFVAADQKKGTACYYPPDGLETGVHSVAVGVQNPNSPNEPTRQAVGWKFEVTP